MTKFDVAPVSSIPDGSVPFRMPRFRVPLLLILLLVEQLDGGIFLSSDAMTVSICSFDSPTWSASRVQ